MKQSFKTEKKFIREFTGIIVDNVEEDTIDRDNELVNGKKRVRGRGLKQNGYLLLWSMMAVQER